MEPVPLCVVRTGFSCRAARSGMLYSNYYHFDPERFTQSRFCSSWITRINNKMGRISTIPDSCILQASKLDIFIFRKGKVEHMSKMKQPMNVTNEWYFKWMFKMDCKLHSFHLKPQSCIEIWTLVILGRITLFNYRSVNKCNVKHFIVIGLFCLLNYKLARIINIQKELFTINGIQIRICNRFRNKFLTGPTIKYVYNNILLKF